MKASRVCDDAGFLDMSRTGEDPRQRWWMSDPTPPEFAPLGAGAPRRGTRKFGLLVAMSEAVRHPKMGGSKGGPRPATRKKTRT
jgi:hypothetical protein